MWGANTQCNMLFVFSNVAVRVQRVCRGRYLGFDEGFEELFVANFQNIRIGDDTLRLHKFSIVC